MLDGAWQNHISLIMGCNNMDMSLGSADPLSLNVETDKRKSFSITMKAVGTSTLL
jgi:hypothetical protein